MTIPISILHQYSDACGSSLVSPGMCAFALLGMCYLVAYHCYVLHAQSMLVRYKGQVPPEDDRSISNLLIDQVEFADVILLNKVDLIRTDKTKQQLLAAIKQMNPLARVIETVRSEVDLKEVIDTGLFNLDKVRCYRLLKHITSKVQLVAGKL